tara:strand:+ start:480 stop:665 length:186 start_codon:yes stop_codon:yes gene_type:complete
MPSKKNISDFDIQALIDGELDLDEEYELLALLENNQAMQQHLEDLLLQKKMLQLWWKQKTH